jgi:hypothetical protein
MPTVKCPPIKEGTDNPPDNYPDYVKKIIKEIELGKDEELKKCLCQLRVPLDDDNCIIRDEDQKWGLFPICWERGGPFGRGTKYPLKLTLKQAMLLWWKAYTISPLQNPTFCNGFAENEGGEKCYDKVSWKNGIKKSTGICNNISPYIVNKDTAKCLVCASAQYWNPEFIVTSANCGTYLEESELGIVIYPKGIINKEGDEYFFYPEFLARSAWSYCCGFDSYYRNNDCFSQPLPESSIGLKIGDDTVSIEGWGGAPSFKVSL